MARIFVPITLAIFGLAAGSTAGVMLRHPGDGEISASPDAHTAESPSSAPPAEAGASPDAAHDAAAGHGALDYTKMSNQFVIPVVEDGRVAYLVVLSLSLEVAAGQAETVFAREPKLRDAFLRVLFDYANSGGFSGAFTDGAMLAVLRRNLLDSAKGALGDTVSDVLITEIMRQDA